MDLEARSFKTSSFFGWSANCRAYAAIDFAYGLSMFFIFDAILLVALFTVC